MSYILLLILIFFAYYFTTRFVLPIYLTTKRVKEQFRNIREQQDANNRQYQQNSQQPNGPPENPKEKVGEYIEFEEVK